MRLLATLVAALVPLVHGSVAWAAAGLNATEAATLARGETVVRAQTVNAPSGRLVGGLTYTVIDATVAELGTIFHDVEAYRKVLPKTKAARLVGEAGPDRWIELTQGTALIETELTLRFRDVDPLLFQFWLEPAAPHGIDDAWGFFRLQPFAAIGGEPRILMTYGVLVDLGTGVVRDLFEERIVAALLSVPQRVRGYVAESRVGRPARADAKQRPGGRD